jgi:hypothetical protein
MDRTRGTIRSISLSVAAISAGILVMTVALPAQADTIPQPTPVTLEAHMSVTGFDAEVAAAHG